MQITLQQIVGKRAAARGKIQRVKMMNDNVILNGEQVIGTLGRHEGCPLCLVVHATEEERKQILDAVTAERAKVENEDGSKGKWKPSGQISFPPSTQLIEQGLELLENEGLLDDPAENEEDDEDNPEE